MCPRKVSDREKQEEKAGVVLQAEADGMPWGSRTSSEPLAVPEGPVCRRLGEQPAALRGKPGLGDEVSPPFLSLFLPVPHT